MKLLDIAYKDLLRSFRSLFAIGMMVVVPLVITGLIYAAFGGMSSGKADLPALKVILVNLDIPLDNQPQLGKLLGDMLKDESVSSWLRVTEMADESSARAAVDRQEAGMAVIIPIDLSASVFANKPGGNILLVQDPTLTTGPLVVKNMMGSFIDGINGAKIAIEIIDQRLSDLGFQVDAASQMQPAAQYQEWYTQFQKTLYHSPATALLITPPSTAGADQKDQAGTMQQLLSLIMAGMMIFFAFYTGAYSMTSIIREDEEGTLARLFSTPTNRTLILAGKFLAVLLTVFIQALVLITVSRFLFKINWGSPLNIAIMVFGQVIAATGLGVLVISLVKSSRQEGPVLGGALTALGMAGGLFTIAVPNLPPAFATVALFTPHGWVMRGWKLVLTGSPSADLLLPLAVMLGMGIIMFFIGASIFRRRFA
jgi:ABC-2 type transport system permease protein